MISVCLATFNGEKYIYQQLSSILSQLSDIDEIIVSDDGSADKTIEIVKSIKDKRIKLFHNPYRQGIIHNVENALRESKGNIIFLSDQDDVWLNNKISVCLQHLQCADLVISDCYVTDESLGVINDSFYSINGSQFGRIPALIKNPYLGCCMAFHRHILKDVLPFPKTIPMHDIWIGNIAAFLYKVTFIPDKLIYYRRHDSNFSTASKPTKANIVKQIRYRIFIAGPLMNRFLKFCLNKNH